MLIGEVNGPGARYGESRIPKIPTFSPQLPLLDTVKIAWPRFWPRLMKKNALWMLRVLRCAMDSTAVSAPFPPRDDRDPKFRVGTSQSTTPLLRGKPAFAQIVIADQSLSKSVSMSIVPDRNSLAGNPYPYSFV